MAKGTGLIGNFKGKVGNTVGYKLSASNNGQTQGIRVYQPIVKNPKTAAQAEQRAKLSPINATYRALKMVIDRGNEGLPYGNKSRLAWLKKAFKATNMPWYVKGDIVECPVICELTRGSLPGVGYTANADGITINMESVKGSTDLSTVGKLSAEFLASYPSLKDGDQITFVATSFKEGSLHAAVKSIVLDATSSVEFEGANAGDGTVMLETAIVGGAVAVIVSREGDNGEHLRSTAALKIASAAIAAAPYDATSKAAAIESYQSSAANNSDWAEESIQ